MKLDDIATAAIDWSTVPPATQAGESGLSQARTCELGAIRLRLVDYSPGYLADHWCHKGHIIHVISGVLLIERQDGHGTALEAGMSYHVADDAGPPHRVLSEAGARVFIVD